MINALLEDTHHNKLTKKHLARKAAGKEIKKAKQDPKLLAAAEETNQKIIANIKGKLPLNRPALPSLKTKADNSETQSTSKTERNLGANQIYVHIHHGETIKINKTRTFTRFVIQLAPHMIVEEDESIWYRTSKFKKWRALGSDEAMQDMYDTALEAGNHLTVCQMLEVRHTATAPLGGFSINCLRLLTMFCCDSPGRFPFRQ